MYSDLTYSIAMRVTAELREGRLPRLLVEQARIDGPEELIADLADDWHANYVHGDDGALGGWLSGYVLRAAEGVAVNVEAGRWGMDEVDALMRPYEG